MLRHDSGHWRTTGPYIAKSHRITASKDLPLVSGSLQPRDGNRTSFHPQKKDIFHTATGRTTMVTEGQSDNGCEEIDGCKDPEPHRKQMHETYTKTWPADVLISSQGRSVLKPIFSISQGGEKPIRKFPTSAPLATDLPTGYSQTHLKAFKGCLIVVPVGLLSGPVRSCQVLSGPVRSWDQGLAQLAPVVKPFALVLYLKQCKMYPANTLPQGPKKSQKSVA